MNQLDLILENIRLGQIEKLYQEAQTDLEIIRGQRLINESMMQVRGALLQEALMQEAVHSNHPHLDKSRLKDPTISYVDGKQIEKNRNKLAENIKNFRVDRDYNRRLGSPDRQKYANDFDNVARGISQIGKLSHRTKELAALGDERYNQMIQSNPRMVQSTRV